MNKLVVFDLDGVLIESRDLHFHALNAALLNIDEKFVISREEHLSSFDGLTTTRKLEILTETRGLSKKEHKRIWEDKQSATFELIKQFPQDIRAIETFKAIKKRGWKIAVASNSIRESVKLALMSIGVLEYVDLFVSNEDVKRAKPFPEMYWKCMTELNALPKNTLIVEDSHIGRQGAIDSGAHLIAVEDTHDWDYNTIFKEIDLVEQQKTQTSIPWRDKNLTVLIPMAGAGSRFAQAGYTFPKPLIEVHNRPMIQLVVENLNIEANYVFIVQKEHYDKYDLQNVLEHIAPGCTIVLTDGLTEGAACTALLAKEYIDKDAPLLISNSDQYIEWNSNECMYAFRNDEIDGGILTFYANHPKWSFAKLDEFGFVSEVAEKKVISDNATVGIYYYRRGSDFVKYAEQMISKNIRVNNEFYIAPVFNEAIQDGKKIRVKQVSKMYGIGTPEDLDIFLKEK